MTLSVTVGMTQEVLIWPNAVMTAILTAGDVYTV
jgi:hypothetical protein